LRFSSCYTHANNQPVNAPPPAAQSSRSACPKRCNTAPSLHKTRIPIQAPVISCTQSRSTRFCILYAPRCRPASARLIRSERWVGGLGHMCVWKTAQTPSSIQLLPPSQRVAPCKPRNRVLINPHSLISRRFLFVTRLSAAKQHSTQSPLEMQALGSRARAAPTLGSKKHESASRSTHLARGVPSSCSRAISGSAHAVVSQILGCGSAAAAQKGAGRGQFTVSAVATEHAATGGATSTTPEQRKLSVCIAGGGVGGLVLATALLKKGIQVRGWSKAGDGRLLHGLLRHRAARIPPPQLSGAACPRWQRLSPAYPCK